MTVSVVSFSFSWAAQPEARGSAFCWMMAFFPATYHQLVSKTPSEVPRAPSPGCGFPFHILSPTSLIPNSIGGPEGPILPGVAFRTIYRL